MDPRFINITTHRKADSSEASTGGERSTLLPRPRKLHILIVDDEPSNRESLQLVLERSGSRITTAANAADALAVFAREPPDILLSDIGMPGGDGYDLIRRVRALPKDQGGDVPAAALTGKVSDEDQQDALRAGFTMHLSKPVDPVELVTAVTAMASKVSS